MTTANFPNRAQIDRAPALDFDGVTRGNDPSLLPNPNVDRKRASAPQPASAPAPAPAERQANITIDVAPDGLHIRAEYTGTLASIPAAIERLKAAGVLDLVAASRPAVTPPAPTAAAPGKPASVKGETYYDDDGARCCAVHRRALKDDRYCPAKAKPGQVMDKKGYCGLKFED